MGNNSNFLLAVVLCLGVLLGWQYFVVDPRLAAEREAAEQLAAERGGAETGETETPAPAPEVSGNLPTPQSSLPTPQNPAAITPAAPAPFTTARVPIETPQLRGSLALTGARLDDLVLHRYAQALAPDAPPQRLLSPAGQAGHWEIRHGWIAADGSGDLSLPDDDTAWELTSGKTLTPETPITLTYRSPSGLVFTRRITVDDKFMFTVTQSVANRSGRAITLYPFGQMTRTDHPDSRDLFILHEGGIGFFGTAGLQEETYDDMAEDGVFAYAAETGWLGMTDKYWAAILVPPQSEHFDGRFTGTPQSVFRSDFLLGGRALPVGGKVSVESRFFAGAKVVDDIDAYGESGINRFDLLIDWGWFFFLTKPMFRALQIFYDLTGNYGVAILLVTIIIKALFFPLANRSYETMAQMKKLQPRIMQIRDAHKDDRQTQQQELMKVYREEKLNPLAGCLPILLQIPVFFALYKVLFVTIDMRHQPFFGWIRDLSAPDPTSLFNLFGLIPWEPPLFLAIGIWPLLMGITMFVQMQMNPPPPDPIQARLFQLMPIFFTFILASFPAGLVIYWTWNNFLSILQQALIMRRNGVAIEIFANMGLAKRRDEPEQ